MTKRKVQFLLAVALIFLLIASQGNRIPQALAGAEPAVAGTAPDTIVTDDGLTFSASEFLTEEMLATEYQPSFTGIDGAADTSLFVDDEPFPGLDGPTPGSVIGADGRIRVNPTTSFPYRAIAQLRVTFPNGGTYGCTGWFIGPRTVATAGHCVYNSSYGGWATVITAYPGKNGTSTPYGSSTAYRKFSVTGWTQSRNWNYDYGAIQLNSPLGNTVGWFGFRWQSSNTFSGSYTVTGYPCDKPSGTMWRMSDNPGIRGVNTYHLFYQIDTYGCQSGSPVYHNYSSSCSTCSTAIHSYGTGQSPYPQYNSGTRITQSVFNNLVAWKNYTYP